MDATEDESFAFPAETRGGGNRAMLGLLLAGSASCWLGAQEALVWPPGWQQAVGPLMLALVCLAMLFWPNAPQTTESLTILPALGLLLGSSSTPTGGEFLPVARISRVVVGEALEGFGARSYLGIVLGDRANVVVAFPNCRIGMADLERVHEAVQRRLWISSGD